MSVFRPLRCWILFREFTLGYITISISTKSSLRIGKRFIKDKHNKLKSLTLAYLICTRPSWTPSSVPRAASAKGSETHYKKDKSPCNSNPFWNAPWKSFFLAKEICYDEHLNHVAEKKKKKKYMLAYEDLKKGNIHLYQFSEHKAVLQLLEHFNIF